MSITTFAALMAEPVSEKIKLAEISPAENLGGNVAWSVYAGTVHMLDYLYETLNLSGGDSAKIPKIVTAMRTIDSASDIVDLIAVTSISDCQADDTSFYHDTTNGVLYVNMDGVAGTDTPLTTLVLLATFTLRFASKGVVLGGYYYDPYLSDAPSINQSASDLFSGRAETATANITFHNDGFWDAPFYKYVWNNRRIAIKFGGEDLPYSEYRTVFTGVINEKSWGREQVDFFVTSIQSKLDMLIPVDTYTLTDYPNIYESAIGEAIPIAYGTFTERTAPIVTAIDEVTDIATDRVTYKLAGHSIKSVTTSGVWILYADGADWVNCAVDDSGSPAANTYTVVSLTSATIKVRFTVGGYAADAVKVKVAFEGKELSAGVLMDAPSDITKDLITTYAGFAEADLDLTEFATSKANSSATLAIYLNKSESLQGVIEKICLSDMAYFFVNDDGKFVYKAFSPTVLADTIAQFTEADLLSYSVRFPSDHEFETIRVQYSQAYNTNQTYQSVLARGDNVGNIYDVVKSKLMNTYLDNASDAEILAQRMATLHTPPFEIIEGVTKWQFGQIELGDRVQLSLMRLPYEGETTPVEEIIEIISLVKNFEDNTISFQGVDIRVFGLHVGFWTAPGSPDWAAASASEKLRSGFWTDSNGRADPGDPASAHKSLWW